MITGLWLLMSILGNGDCQNAVPVITGVALEPSRFLYAFDTSLVPLRQFKITGSCFGEIQDAVILNDATVCEVTSWFDGDVWCAIPTPTVINESTEITVKRAAQSSNTVTLGQFSAVAEICANAQKNVTVDNNSDFAVASSNPSDVVCFTIITDLVLGSSFKIPSPVANAQSQFGTVVLRGMCANGPCNITGQDLVVFANSSLHVDNLNIEADATPVIRMPSSPSSQSVNLTRTHIFYNSTISSNDERNCVADAPGTVICESLLGEISQAGSCIPVSFQRSDGSQLIKTANSSIPFESEIEIASANNATRTKSPVVFNMKPAPSSALSNAWLTFFRQQAGDVFNEVATVRLTNVPANGSFSVSVPVDIRLASQTGFSESGDFKLTEGIYRAGFFYESSGMCTPKPVMSAVFTIDAHTEPPVLVVEELSEQLVASVTLPELPLGATAFLTILDKLTQTSRKLHLDGFYEQKDLVPVLIDWDRKSSPATGLERIYTVEGFSGADDEGYYLPDGDYTMTLSYQDGLGNATASVSKDVVFDAKPPQLTEASITLQGQLAENVVQMLVDGALVEIDAEKRYEFTITKPSTFQKNLYVQYKFSDGSTVAEAVELNVEEVP